MQGQVRSTGERSRSCQFLLFLVSLLAAISPGVLRTPSLGEVSLQRSTVAPSGWRTAAHEHAGTVLSTAMARLRVRGRGTAFNKKLYTQLPASFAVQRVAQTLESLNRRALWTAWSSGPWQKTLKVAAAVAAGAWGADGACAREPQQTVAAA